MGVPVLILGKSGQGKSTSLRNFKKGEVGIFNVVGKPLPFRNDLDKADRATYSLINGSLMRNNLNCYVVDDANYLMQFDNFKRAKETGYGKFIDMASDFEHMLECVLDTSADTTVYVLMHYDTEADGSMKPKSIGRMLDEKLCIEGLFPITLVAKRTDDGYVFETQTDGYSLAKSPIGMFADVQIENDLVMVDDIIREYYGMAKRSAAPQKEGGKDGK